jgi:hypothetical protein
VPPTTFEESRALREWAENQPLTVTNAAMPYQLTKRLQYMDATLPTRKSDDLNGEMRTTVYVSLLTGYSDEALAHMVRTACATLDWFPSPRQCLAILADYRPPASDRDTALRLCHDFAENTFSRWMANVADGQPIGDAPERWFRIAVEQGVMRRLADGKYVSRALYQGPSIAPGYTITQEGNQ